MGKKKRLNEFNLNIFYLLELINSQIRGYSLFLCLAGLISWVVSNDRVPGNDLLDQVSDKRDDLVQRNLDLFHGETLSEGDEVLFDGVEVNSDGEWDTDLVSSGVSLSNGLSAGVDSGADSCLLESPV